MKREKNVQSKEPDGRQMVLTTVILVLVALVSVTAATVAWFSIADRTKVKSMSMEITTGSNLRFDLDSHEEFDDYVKTLTFEQIAARINREKGFDMRTVPLEPVTTANYHTFTLENGTVVESSKGAYLEFMLHFMATEDMVVHLTGANSDGKNDGTRVMSSNSSLPRAMRISFTVGNETKVYDPGAGNSEIELFPLKEYTNQPVMVHIWLEGTDEECTDALRGADYAIQLRFVGTDEDGNVLDGAEKTN